MTGVFLQSQIVTTQRRYVNDTMNFIEITQPVMWYCRVQKEFAFEIASRVASTKRVMQSNIEHEWPKAMSV